jgi:putative membrane protein
MMWGWGGGWGMPFGGPLLLLIVVAVAIYFFSRGNRGASGSSSREILDRRYAAGEITKEQYEQMKRDLAS